MNNIVKLLAIFVVNFPQVFGNAKCIPDERVQTCKGPKLGKGDIAHGTIADVDLDFLVDDDENVILNGTITFKADMEDQSTVIITGEKYEQGDWHRRLVKVLQNVCFDLFNPIDIFYQHFKDQKQCPYKSGVSFEIIS